MRPIILFRLIDESFNQEKEVAKKYFDLTESRMDIQKDDVVIGRYSVLPFYKDLENDINKVGAKLINTYEQHRYIADLKNWYEDCKDFTPKTWMWPNEVPLNETGGFVLKGETNSKKFLWNSHMFAPDRSKIMDVYCKLQDDSLLGQQNIYIRKYVKLKCLMEGLNGLNVSNEYRFFCYKDRLLSGGFYWSNCVEDLGINIDANNVPLNFIEKVIGIVGKNTNFYVIDIAETEDGEWILIEVNDGQMSGLSENEPDKLYYNLFNWMGKCI